jgi:hypothetical protein
MTRLGRRSPFFAGAWSATAPLWLWAGHFAFCYAATAAGCTAILQHGSLEPQHLRLLLLAATGLALALGAWLLWRACRAAAGGQGGLLPQVRVAAAVLAWVAMAWAGVPLLLPLPLCLEFSAFPG